MSSPPTTTTAGCCSSSHLTAEPDATAPQQHLHPPLRGAVGRDLGAGDREEGNEARPRSQGRHRTDLPGDADRPGHRSQAAATSTARSKSSASGSTASASPSPRSRGSEPTGSRSAFRTSPTPSAPRNRSGSTAQLYFYDWEPNLLGREKAIGGNPGQTAARLGDQRSEQGMGSGRPQHHQTGKPAADLRRRLPERLRGGETGRRTGTETGLRKMLQQPDPVLPVLSRRKAQADRRPRVHQSRSVHHRHREKAGRGQEVRKAQIRWRTGEGLPDPRERSRRGRWSSPNSPPTAPAR